MIPDNIDGWTEKKSEVMWRLGQIDAKLSNQDIAFEKYKEDRAKELQSFREETKTNFAYLNVKSGLWGAAGSAIPVVILLLIEFFKSK